MEEGRERGELHIAAVPARGGGKQELGHGSQPLLVCERASTGCSLSQPACKPYQV